MHSVFSREFEPVETLPSINVEILRLSGLHSIYRREPVFRILSRERENVHVREARRMSWPMVVDIMDFAVRALYGICHRVASEMINQSQSVNS